MLETIKLKYFQGKQYIKDIQNAPMREQFRGFPTIKSGNIDCSCCPTGALRSNPNSIDLGKCTLCGNCKCEAIQFSNRYKLGSTSREKLIISEINENFPCDTKDADAFFPEFKDSEWILEKTEPHNFFTVFYYRHK